MRIGYGKIGRSMPLTLENCGNLGGDVEMAAVVKELALRHPRDTFVLIGRNDLSVPINVGLPSNVQNPWIEWAPVLRRELNARGLNHANLAVEEQITCREIFRDLTEDTIRDLDGIVLWVGQHGTTNTPVPSIQRPGQLTKPHDWSTYYCSFLLQGVNAWRDRDPLRYEEVYLNADARNRHKMRDLKWPLRHPILTQYTFNHPLKHERYGDFSYPTDFWKTDGVTHMDNPFVWYSTCRNVYSRLEINGLAPGTPFGSLVSYNDDWERPGHFGLFINEARSTGIKDELARLTIMRGWILPLEPSFVHGTWSTRSQALLGTKISAAPWERYYPQLHSVRCTLTTPSSGSGWATAKPWEAFAAGTVCFFHPAYDTQDNIFAGAPPWLRDWLRVTTPHVLERRVKHLNSEAGRADWQVIVHAQRTHFEAALQEKRYLDLIEKRLYGVK